MTPKGLLAAGIVVLLLVAGGLAWMGVGGGRASDDLADDPSTTTTTASAASIEATIVGIEAFVAKTRGLAFKAKVPVALLDGAEFKARLLDDAEEGRAELDLSERVLRAVGLLRKGVDLYDVVNRFAGDAVVGFYDPKRHELAVRSGRLSPYARTVLAHELTHALDDQWFGIDRPALDEPGQDEAQAAFTSLVEGNAVRVQEAYAETMSRSDRVQAALEEQRLGGSVDLTDVPRVVPELISFPYVAGPIFVRALRSAGGEARINEAFRDPPTTTADIVDPKSWLAGVRPVAVAPVTANGKVLDRGLFGHESLFVALEPVVGTDEAKVAADGWAGDSYVAWDAGSGSTCVRARFAMATPTDLTELRTSLRTWAAERHATLEERPTTVGFTSCD